MRWLGMWFWSPIREHENSAQTIVRVLGNLFRTSITIVVLGIAAIVAALMVSDMNSRKERAKKEQTRARISVDVAVLRDDQERIDFNNLLDRFRAANESGKEEEAGKLRAEARKLMYSKDTFVVQCPIGYPLGVYVENRSNMVLGAATVQLTARRNGSSVNELNYTEGRVNWTDYVPPLHALVSCYSINRTKKDFIYSGEFVDYSIELIEVEDWKGRETTAWIIQDPSED